MDLDLTKYSDLIEKSLEKILPRKYTPETLAKTLDTDPEGLDVGAINKAINEPMWDLFDRGGKRWRPILFLTIVDLLGVDPEKFIDLAVVFEVIHNATLVVDDLEDLSESRRGKKAIHLIYGNDIAINAGNSLYYLPIKILRTYQGILTERQIAKIQQIYIDEMVNLGFGQATDIAWHNNLVDSLKITEAQYLQMCAFKTGGLARMACKIAALVGGADESLITAIGKMGESLGVVFQIQDDILNITENELSKLKGLGEDMTEGKRSLPVIYALHGLPKEKADRLMEILLMHTTDKNLISEAISLINKGEGIEKAKETMEKLFNRAWEKLDNQLPESDKKTNLYNLAKFLIERTI